jgi:hypothetical protein
MKPSGGILRPQRACFLSVAKWIVPAVAERRLEDRSLAQTKCRWPTDSYSVKRSNAGEPLLW